MIMICVTRMDLNMFRYDGKSEDELSLLPGDILKPLREVEPGWWAALIGEQISNNSFYCFIVFKIKTDFSLSCANRWIFERALHFCRMLSL